MVLTIKHFLDKYDALEGIVASQVPGSRYNRTLGKGKLDRTLSGTELVLGCRCSCGFWDEGTNPNMYNQLITDAVFGADGVLGLEYTFDDFPLNLSLDILPTVNLFGSTGWGGINGALSIRYVF